MRKAPTLAITESGDPLTDLRTLVSSLVTEMANSPIGRAVVALMLGAPMYRWLTTGQPIDAHTAQHIVDVVWASALCPNPQHPI